MKRLLAKSTATPDHPHGSATLQGHTAMVMASAERLVEARGTAALHAMGFAATEVDRLARLLRVATFAHDLGKCSDHFQGMVRGNRKEPQLIRHEALSLWMTWPHDDAPLHDWLRCALRDDEEHAIAVLAAAGHHRKFWSRAVAGRDEGAGTRITLCVDHPDFAALLGFGQKQLGLHDPPTFVAPRVIEVSRRSSPEARLRDWQEDADRLVPPNSEASRWLALIKAMVLCADVAGSALPKGHASPAWITEQLGAHRGRAVFDDIVSTRLGANELRPFQRAVASSDAPVTLVRGGCGSGKTLAAYAWARDQHPTRQLWVTYPTTGTSTEGFRDYLHRSGAQGPEVAARLEHGRAHVDYDIFALYQDGETARELDRLDSIRAWGDEVIACTVDTVLGLIQNQRKGLYGWPGICQGAVVFDEVHAYDARLFACLLRFLEALPGVPALLMTASLPAARLARLRAVVQRTHGRALREIDGPEDLEALPRYHLVPCDEPWGEVAATLAKGGKVLWVSNQVNVCRDRAAAWRSLPLPSLYHSRFRYVDRVRRHRDVVDAFARPGPALAMTTQVAEMSLDLSADLLLTDLAPIPSMIQRLGRLNRRSHPDAPRPVGRCLVLPVSSEKPYERAQLDAARAWVHALAHRDTSQRDLVAAWPQGDDADDAVVQSAWLDGRYQTEPSHVRDGEAGITVLLARDAPRVADGTFGAVEVALPMGPPPRGCGWRSWPTQSFLPVAPDDAIEYDEERGARWRSV